MSVEHLKQKQAVIDEIDPAGRWSAGDGAADVYAGEPPARVCPRGVSSGALYLFRSAQEVAVGAVSGLDCMGASSAKQGMPRTLSPPMPLANRARLHVLGCLSAKKGVCTKTTPGHAGSSWPVVGNAFAGMPYSAEIRISLSSPWS